jgi:hypothetical protein
METELQTIKNKDLLKALENSLPVFEVFKKQISEISDDIKNTENILRNLCIIHSFRLEIKGAQVPSNNKYYLEWDEDPESKGRDFRLMARVLDAGSVVVVHRPLISTKAQHRIIFHPHLSDFITDLAAFVKSKGKV